MDVSLEGAAGIAGVIKAVLVLERGVIPPNTNFEKPNPKIDAEFLKIKVCLKCSETNAPTNVDEQPPSSLKSQCRGRLLVCVVRP